MSEHDEFGELDSVAVICPACWGEQSVYMGTRGALMWFRCRHCGAEYSLQAHEGHSRLTESDSDDNEAETSAQREPK